LISKWERKKNRKIFLLVEQYQNIGKIYNANKDKETMKKRKTSMQSELNFQEAINRVIDCGGRHKNTPIYLTG